MCKIIANLLRSLSVFYHTIKNLLIINDILSILIFIVSFNLYFRNNNNYCKKQFVILTLNKTILLKNWKY